MTEVQAVTYEDKSEYFSVTPTIFILLTVISLGLFPFVWWLLNLYKVMERRTNNEIPPIFLWPISMLMTIFLPLSGYLVLKELREHAKKKMATSTQ